MDEVLAYELWEDDGKRKAVSPEYFLRRIYRWYSKTFFTPLHEAFKLDVGFVLQQYYETRYEEMEDVERMEEAEILAETEEETAERLAQEKADKEADDDFLKMVEAEEASKSLRKAVKMGEDLANKVQSMGQLLTSVVVPQAEAAVQEMVQNMVPPPDIKMEVVSDEEIRRIEEENWAMFGGGEPYPGDDGDQS